MFLKTFKIDKIKYKDYNIDWRMFDDPSVMSIKKRSTDKNGRVSVESERLLGFALSARQSDDHILIDCVIRDDEHRDYVESSEVELKFRKGQYGLELYSICLRNKDKEI